MTAMPTIDPIVNWLNAAPDSPLLGGKARVLARLAAAGMPVPPGFVLTADALPAGPPAEHGVDTIPLPKDAAAALAAAYAQLGVCLAQPDPLVAVRSSALAEDLAQASFAGQYVTVLGVRGEQAVLDAAARCAASLWSPGVAAYRAAVQQRTGQSLPPPGMAILVQALVPATAAGVAETADPLSGSRATVLVSGVWGLGRALVDGAVEPDTWRVERTTLAVRELHIGDKQVRATAGDAVGQEPVPDELRRQPCLTLEQAAAVAAVALEAEAAIGGPADVEWALSNGRIWLLQARPLTGSAAAVLPAEPPGPIGPTPTFPFVWPDEATPALHWRREAEDGRAFEAYPPFELDARQAFTRGLAQAEWFTGAPSTSRNLEVNGYLYSAQAPVPDEADRARRAEVYLRAVHALHAHGQTLFASAILPEIQADTRRLASVALDSLDAPTLAAHFEELLRWYEHAWSLHFTMDPWDEHSPIGRLSALYRELTGDTTSWAVYMPFAHAPQQEHEAVARLIDLARFVCSTPALHALFTSAEPAAVLRDLDATAGGQDFRRQLDALLMEFGLHCGASQGVLCGQVLPGWGEDPSLVIALVQRYLPQNLDVLSEAYRRAGEQYRRSMAELRERVAGSAATSEQLAEFDVWVAAAECQVLGGLNHNHHIDSPANALLHRALMICGRRLVAAGMLDDPMDVWWLRVHQIVAALRSLAAPDRPDWRQLVTAHKALHAWQRSLTPPAYLGKPSAAHAAATPASDTTERLPSNLLVRGQGAVPGVVVGRVRLVDERALVPDVQPGDVFVARDCGVLWAMLLPIATAVVLDGSNPHEHAMRVCRDFDVPGVVQTREATRVLQEGQQVIVDGTKGWVLAG